MFDHMTVYCSSVPRVSGAERTTSGELCFNGHWRMKVVWSTGALGTWRVFIWGLHGKWDLAQLMCKLLDVSLVPDSRRNLGQMWSDERGEDWPPTFKLLLC